jgi:glycosyltransferase involved in cell wall biosynthesis
MKRRLVILTEIIAPYRIPVFNALAERDEVDPHVIFLSETDRSLREWHVYKDEIRFSYEVLPSFRRRVGKYNILLKSRTTRALRESNPDLIVSGGYNYLAAWQAALWARKHRVPLLMWVESNSYDQRSRHLPVEYLKKKIMSWCDGFIVPGQMSAEYVRSLGASTEQIFLAPNAVDNEFFMRATDRIQKDSGERSALRLPQHYFLYVGRLVGSKGVFDLLEAYASLPVDTRRNFGLVFAGSGACERDLRRRAAAVPGGTICFGGFAQREQLAIFYALADILVFPTHSDPWGLVVNEAMACGLPVICSRFAGCSADLVRDGQNGCIVAPGNLDELAAAMKRLAMDPELRGRMGGESRRRIAEFSPAAWAQGVARAVECVVDSCHG